MNFFGGQFPIFLGSVSGDCCEVAPQVMFFDAYYDSAPVVGFHVVGDPDYEQPTVSLCVEGDNAGC